MDKDLQFFIDGALGEEKQMQEAQRKRVEWNDKENGHRNSYLSFLQLAANRAAALNAPLPIDLVDKILLSVQGLSNAERIHLQRIKEAELLKRAMPDEPLRRMDKEPPLQDLPRDNKMAFVRLFVKRSMPNGVTPIQIKKAAVAHGLNGVTSSFPHTILFKLKETEKIHEKDGQYFYGREN
jgi:hypothetical protein